MIRVGGVSMDVGKGRSVLVERGAKCKLVGFKNINFNQDFEYFPEFNSILIHKDWSIRIVLNV